VFVEFLKKLMHDAPGPVFLVLDNVSFHKSPVVKNYVTSLEGRLKVAIQQGVAAGGSQAPVVNSRVRAS
jgi:hypothetical protein